MRRASRPLPLGLGPALIALAAFALCAAVSFLPPLQELARLGSGEAPWSQPWRLWLAPLAHPSAFDAALSALGVGLALVVFPRRDMAAAFACLLAAAPLCSALSAALSPQGASIGGLSASLFFIGSMASLRLALGPRRPWSERAVGACCLFMLVSRAFFSLALYEAEPLASQAAIVARCAGASLGLAFGAAWVGAETLARALSRFARSQLRSLN